MSLKYGKKIQLSLLFSFLVVISLIVACQSSPITQTNKLQGKTMGTYYAITYIGTPNTIAQPSIDSLLQAFNQSVSTYIPNSTISKVNQFKVIGVMGVDAIFEAVFKAAKKIHQTTEGAFDPTVMPLVNAWGFGFDHSVKADSSSIDSLLQLVDFDQLELIDIPNAPQLKKGKANIMLDFSAIAKGYAVDLVGQYLAQKGMEHYLVDIGGEMVAKGKNDKGDVWRVGIDQPTDTLTTRQAAQIIGLKNEAIATSGNYRNYFEKDGKKYGHTINPKTGYPTSNLLSASVIAPDCMTADAYATACMVMGYSDASALIEKDTTLKAVLMYADSKGKLIKSYVNF